MVEMSNFVGETKTNQGLEDKFICSEVTIKQTSAEKSLIDAKFLLDK